MLSFIKKEKKLGVAREKRRYDLPLDKSGNGAWFLVLLVALMTFLLMLALSASFALSAMTGHWTSGIANKITIEIPTQGADGKILSSAEIADISKNIESLLRNDQSVISIEILSEKDIAELVRPWLGDTLQSGNIPLPGLVSAELNDTSPKIIDHLENSLKNLYQNIRIDTHEEWLNDIMRFAGTLNFFAFFLISSIGFTTMIAVAGAMQSRMAVHHTEVELLHLMGAHDNYIASQFQRYAFFISLKGAVFGTLAGALALMLMRWASGDISTNLIPGYKIGYTKTILLALLPLLMAMTAFVTARHTVLKNLSELP